MQRKGVRATRSAAAGRARVLGGRILLYYGYYCHYRWELAAIIPV